MVASAVLVIAAGAGLNHRAADLALLGAALLLSTVVGLYLLADFRSAPAGFPWSEDSQAAQGRMAGQLRSPEGAGFERKPPV
jgi:hypothetical protein